MLASCLSELDLTCQSHGKQKQTEHLHSTHPKQSATLVVLQPDTLCWSKQHTRSIPATAAYLPRWIFRLTPAAPAPALARAALSAHRLLLLTGVNTGGAFCGGLVVRVAGFLYKGTTHMLAGTCCDWLMSITAGELSLIASTVNTCATPGGPCRYKQASHSRLVMQSSTAMYCGQGQAGDANMHLPSANNKLVDPPGTEHCCAEKTGFAHMDWET